MIIFKRSSTSLGYICLQGQKVWSRYQQFSGNNKFHAGSDSSAARVDMLVGIWNHQMEVFYTRAVQYQRLETFLAIAAHKKYRTNLEAGRRHPTSSVFGMVFVTGGRHGLRVMLTWHPSNYGCACKSYQCEHFPCHEDSGLFP